LLWRLSPRAACACPQSCSTEKGYDGKGNPIKGREVNLRKRDTVAARKPGDMAASDDTALIARAKAVMNGEPLPTAK
jgi:hypothetical protein